MIFLRQASLRKASQCKTKTMEIFYSTSTSSAFQKAIQNYKKSCLDLALTILANNFRRNISYNDFIHLWVIKLYFLPSKVVRRKIRQIKQNIKQSNFVEFPFCQNISKSIAQKVSLQELGQLGIVNQFSNKKLLTLFWLFVLYPSPLHPELLHIAQQQILFIVNIPLLASLNRLRNSHPHHIYSKFCFCTHRQNTFIDVLQLQTLDALDDGLKLKEEPVMINLISFGQNHLDIDIILIRSLQKLYVRYLKPVLKINAKKDLRQSG